MNQTDNRILELLDESGLVLSPAVIAINLEYSRNWTSRRLSILADAGLIEQVEGAYYRITETGQDYLEGNLDGNELEEYGPSES